MTDSAKPEYLRPIDKARAARLYLATFDQNMDRYNEVLREALTEDGGASNKIDGAIARLIFCLVDDASQMMAKGVGVEHARAWANQVIFDATLDEEGL